MYPLKFEPFLRTMVWGGKKIARYKGVDTDLDRIGESWEVSDVKGHESVVTNGPLAGRILTDLVREYRGQLVGEKVYRRCGDEFPLLIKFIDAQSDLSIQVHPDDAMAMRRHGERNGKTEMWYVVAADPGACLYSGLKEEITPESYAERVSAGTITEVLARHDVHPGDVFFLPAGRIHAICSGCLIAEIQQTSDLTYRIYDYNRPGLDGKPRQLHTEWAKTAIDYTVYDNYRTEYPREKDEEMQVADCPYFTTSVYDLTLPYAKDLSDIDSFMVVMCLEGSGTLEVDGEEMSIGQGETVLIPADADDICFIPEDGMKVLTSYIR